MIYDVILVDPPWAYSSKKTGGSMKSGSAAKYPTLSTEALRDLSRLIVGVSHPGTVLFLWATTPMKPEALLVMQDWVFKYKTTFYWHKTGRLGLGAWFRGEVEELLVGGRAAAKAFRCQRRNHLALPATKHSKKPEEFQDIIDGIFPEARKLELFATRKREGWTTIGLEIDGKDIREALSELARLDTEGAPAA